MTDRKTSIDWDEMQEALRCLSALSTQLFKYDLDSPRAQKDKVHAEKMLSIALKVGQSIQATNAALRAKVEGLEKVLRSQMLAARDLANHFGNLERVLAAELPEKPLPSFEDVRGIFKDKQGALDAERPEDD